MERSAEAFAPAAISNFFTISGPELDRLTPESDLHHVGATGGGYMLSRGVRTRVTLKESPGAAKVEEIVVDGDPAYEARTTRTAAELLLRDAGVSDCSIRIEQKMEVPVGRGFGASAASALSSVNALAAALGLKMPPAQVAYFAHAADILCRTGLGTVSVTYRYGGAGIIVRPGAPGAAEVREVHVPPGARIVTASLAPFRKSVILSSREARDRVNKLGEQALRNASALTLESLVRAGEEFSRELGLQSPDVSRLIFLARSSGAMGASQNMVGHAVHAVAWDEDAERVASALRSDQSRPVVSVYGFASGSARR